MKYLPLIICTLFVGCQTTRQQACICGPNDVAELASQFEANDQINTRYLTTEDKINLASELINNDASEQALDILESIPTRERTAKFNQLERDAINKAVVNMRFKVRMLYQKSLQQTGSTKLQTLKQSKSILENIVKKYPNYNDMNSIKNNLKQLERELARKS